MSEVNSPTDQQKLDQALPDMLRKITIVLNVIVVAVSLTFFGYTFFAKAHLTEHTRAFVTEKTIAHSETLMEFTKVGLATPLFEKEQRELIQAEIALYESDPVQYVTSLTSSDVNSLGEGKPAEIKESIRAHFQSTLTALTHDLRIFSGSNVVAGLFALWILCAAKLKRNEKAVAFSFIMFAAVAMSTYSYVDGMSFFRILFRTHLGWWYPAAIVITIIKLVLEHGLHKGQTRKPTSDSN